MIAIIVISLVVTALATILFFKNQNDTYHLNRAKRKEQSIVLALRYYIIEHEINAYNMKLSRKLSELANVNNLDINAYNLNGQLIYSAEDRENTIGLVRDKIPVEFVDKVLADSLPVIVEEELNDQNYLSTYFVMKGEKGRPIAIINIPYHKDSERIKEELTSFLWTLIQIYVFIFIGTSIMAYFLSNYFTKSLKAISEGMKNLQIDGRTPRLVWDSNDEIGELVNDYNRMVDELERSAELLAKSERESAWKEMARQVAHEIKNPLTPMRLNIQHLQRIMDERPDEIKEHLEKFTKLMLEQIDTLSRIASEFSNFAQMPQPEIEKLDLEKVINAAVHLFENTREVAITFVCRCKEPILVEADKRQLIRVFNNLISNAIQARKGTENDYVKIVLSRDGDKAIVEIEDNGKGIPEEEQSKIFQPYFTTKSGGTGLGLAMVRSILSVIGAEISFVSTEGENTRFTLIFRAV